MQNLFVIGEDITNLFGLKMDKLFFTYYAIDSGLYAELKGVLYHTIVNIVISAIVFLVIFFMRKKLKLSKKNLIVIAWVIFLSQAVINIFLIENHKRSRLPLNEVQEYVCRSGINGLDINIIFGLNMAEVKDELDGKTIGETLSSYCRGTQYPYVPEQKGISTPPIEIPKDIIVPEGAEVITFKKEDIILQFDGNHITFGIDDKKLAPSDS